MAVQGASFSSLSSSTRWWTYDVFLSFRGEDTRQNFTAHLHEALDRKKINSYIDYKLPSGEEISDELLKAIESSRISIVVLSKNYASSRWCLDELLKILECKKTKQQKVLPVFYDVDPTKVRHQREVFGKALAKLKERFKDESKVERWKAALTEVAGLSGFTLGERTEAELIQEIVREVSKVVKPKYLNNVAKHPVGMESRVQDVHDILLRVGENDTRILGIYGTGGIGKTTLAKVIYNTFTDQFENCCFLANVRETSKREDGLIKLQETLLCEILGDWSLKVRNKDEGMGQIKKMLWSKRVLLVLDDLDQWDEVEKYLLGGCGWYGLGSVIIITTRDEHLLTRNDVHLRYKVKELDPDEALQLFRWNAFRNPNPNHDFEEITEKVLHYVGGLPLALMVVGSDLFGRDLHYWRSALEKYKKNFHKDIFEMLKISYDGLDESVKNIFLDIACTFVGEGEEYVPKVLDSCGFFATCGIKVLVDKSLITISERDGLIRMHDLLKDMGREMKRSRLWFHEDVRHVLEETKGTNKIEAISLDFPEGHDDKQIRLHSKAFEKSKRLRLFINWNAQLSRVLDWSEYPLSFLPSNFHGNNNLVDWPNSLITFKNLTLMNLRGCKSLTKILDLSSCPNLGALDLSNCENLVEVHDSVKLRMPNSLITFKNLTVMNLSGCKSLTKIPDLSSCPNLEGLYLSNCENLVEVHHSVGFLDKLWNFSAEGCCKLRIFPKRFKLRSLRFFNLDYCSSLEYFPEIECKKLSPEIWKSLQVLRLRFCCLSESNFITNGNYFPALETLDISGSNIVIFPPQSVRFATLRDLCLNNCKKLVEILPLPSSLERVEARECTSLESFALLSEILIKNNGTNFSNFLRIDLSRCHKLLANMWPIPSWEEKQNWAEPLKRERGIDIIFPGKRIPNWFSYRNEAHDSILFQIDIKPPHHCYGILLYVVFGFRVGIIDPITDDGYTPVVISVEIHDGSDEEELSTQVMRDSWMDSDHVWMYGKCYRPDKQTVSRVTFKCKSKLVVFRRIGIHFLRLGSKFHYYSSDEEIDSSLDLMYEKRHSSISELDNDDENPKEDLELENDDENLKEIFGKRRRHDEYDCNLEDHTELDDRDCRNLLLLPNLENSDLGDCENLDLSKEAANLAGEHLEDRSIAYTSSSMAFSLPSFSSASTSSTLNWSYDVFLSFRGIDSRNTFSAFLYSALCQRGIKTYTDDRDLGRGETISPTLMKVIEDSMISIIILSPNYASSISCLEELTKILECKKTKQQIVLPVFYHVDPSDVRHLRGRFGEALAKHQERFKEDPKVQKWKESLQEVAGLSREHLEDGNEYELMHKIIKWVDSTMLKSTYPLDIAEHPIGLESRLKDLNTNLEIGRNDITLMIGIYGTGGIGKSTLAKAIFNSIGRQFEARCFLANVRESSSQKDGLGQLQVSLLYELLGNYESFNISSFGGTDVIKHRLCSKRVLIILDDVNELWQLKELAGNHNWFGPGSRIVITTRDQHLLTDHKVDSMHEVQGLDDNQAIQLFSLHAFERDNPVESYVELTKAIIGYAKGLPLALIVLGSYLRDKSIQEWESALKKYERSPHKDIYEILKISYDGLDDDEKNIFLDIACFFKGKSVEYVTKILDSCGFSSYFGIARLKDKCLINIRSQCVEMHDLLQGMGKEIVRQESPKEAGKRSRLWFHEEVRRVLEENSETSTIEGILLDFPEGDDKICLHSEAFKKMKNLRLFINRNAQFSAGPNYLPNEIRVLDWSKYPSSFLPSNFRGNNLVEFRMPNSLIKELGGLKFKNLIVMDLRYCKFITKIPDLSSSPNLENLDLGDCENLVEVHHSVGFLDKLWSFSATGCCKLRIFPKRFKLRSLRVFSLKYCLSLEDFPEIECEMEFLHELSLRGTSIKELPSSIENLKGLEKLYLDRSSLKKIPSSIGNLTRLQELYAAGSSSSAIWKSLQVSNFFPALVELDISGSDIVIFPAQSVRFTSLRHLWLNNCKKLEEILPLPLSISTVQARECPSLESFALLSDILILLKNNGTNFSNFLRIDLYGCHKLLANIMRPIPSWEERHSEEQNRANHFEDRYIDIVFPGKRIPSWFSYRKEAHDSNLCEIDINRPHHWNDIDEIVLYVVLGFRVGITDPIVDDAYITVKIHDGSDWEDLYTRDMTFSWTDSDHVWMLWKSYGKEVDVSRFRFECDAEFVVFRRVGIHFLKKPEENVRDEDHTGDEGGDCWLDFMVDFYCGAIFNFLRCLLPS